MKELTLQQIRRLIHEDVFPNLRGELYNSWAEYFKEYNDDHDKKIGMRCTPCYMKVYFYLKKKHQVIHGEGKEPEGIMQSFEGGQGTEPPLPE